MNIKYSFNIAKYSIRPGNKVTLKQGHAIPKLPRNGKVTWPCMHMHIYKEELYIHTVQAVLPSYK